MLLPSQAPGQKEAGEGQGSLNTSQEILFIAPVGRGKREMWRHWVPDGKPGLHVQMCSLFTAQSQLAMTLCGAEKSHTGPVSEGRVAFF